MHACEVLAQTVRLGRSMKLGCGACGACPGGIIGAARQICTLLLGCTEIWGLARKTTGLFITGLHPHTRLLPKRGALIADNIVVVFGGGSTQESVDCGLTSQPNPAAVTHPCTQPPPASSGKIVSSSAWVSVASWVRAPIQGEQQKLQHPHMVMHTHAYIQAAAAVRGGLLLCV